MIPTSNTDQYYRSDLQQIGVNSEVTLADVALEQAESREYERVVVATATLEGPAGRVRIRRTYEALPRHNDVVDRTAANVDDELVDRPDAVHVYTTVRENGEYRGDSHETWRPDDPGVLADPTAFRVACRDHLRATAGEAYDRATGERE